MGNTSVSGLIFPTEHLQYGIINVDVPKAAHVIQSQHIDTAMGPNAEIRHIAAMHHAASPQHHF